MFRLYFLANAFLWLPLSLICTIWQMRTARSIGFLETNQAGKAEYLVVYGGMQLSFALIYFYFSREPTSFRHGIALSLCLYAPLVLYRLASLIIYRPTNAITLGTAAFEWVMLIWAVVLWRKLP